MPVGTRAIGADGNAPLPAQARALPADSDITLIDGGSLDNNDFMWPLALAGVVLIVVGAGQSHADKIKNALHVLNPKHQRLVATIFLT